MKIKLENPCPMALAITKNNSDFYCKSCDKKLIDFREKTMEEINNFVPVNSTCGIFTNDQIVEQNFSLKYKFTFKVLVIISILGFNVKPILSQTKQVKQNDTLSNNKQLLGNAKSKNFNDTLSLKEKPNKWWRKKVYKKNVCAGYF